MTYGEANYKAFQDRYNAQEPKHDADPMGVPYCELAPEAKECWEAGAQAVIDAYSGPEL